jgi:hypothetical protein
MLSTDSADMPVTLKTLPCPSLVRREQPLVLVSLVPRKALIPTWLLLLLLLKVPKLSGLRVLMPAPTTRATGVVSNLYQTSSTGCMLKNHLTRLLRSAHPGSWCRGSAGLKWHSFFFLFLSSFSSIWRQLIKINEQTHHPLTVCKFCAIIPSPDDMSLLRVSCDPSTIHRLSFRAFSPCPTHLISILLCSIVVLRECCFSYLKGYIMWERIINCVIVKEINTYIHQGREKRNDW